MSKKTFNKDLKKVISLIALLAIFLTLLKTDMAMGANVDELRGQIQDKTSKIQELEASIKQLNDQLTATGKEKSSLQSAINSLDLTRKKLVAELQVTQNQISATDLTIEQLGIQINDKNKKIEDGKKDIASIFRKLQESDETSLLETFLVYGNTSELWNEVESLNQIKIALRTKVTDLTELKKNLTQDKNEKEAKKEQLVALESQLGDRKTLVDQNTKEKTNLLTVTKNKESNYQKTLAAQKALQEQFQNELSSLESQLKEIVNPKSIPSAGAGILSWPVDSVKITQEFGYTDFAKNNPAYNGLGHNGLDFGASVGTPIKTTLSGVVQGTGNTDLACPGASYGKWVLIRHYNGLTTLYAHLSIIKATEGQIVQTGDVIGYSGNTGYTTGPHLHLGLFATDGVAISSYNFKSCSGASVSLPRATKRGAYLDPLKYL